MDSPPKPALSPPHPVELCLDKLRDQLLKLVNTETTHKETIAQLQSELSAYKMAFSQVDDNFKATRAALLEAEALNVQLRDECLALRKHDKGNRVVALIDGDGAIFSPQLIAQGLKGGHLAAQKISDATMQVLSEEYGTRPYQLWVYVFFNKNGLFGTFRRTGFAALSAKLEEFVQGFNQATERFLMIDVGVGKEAADAKLKVYLEDEIRLPETFKVIFGGCHDNGYVANLHSQITAGYKEKLILLKTYNDMAAGIAALDLPQLSITDLFMPQKIADELQASLATANGNGKTKAGGVFGPMSGNVSLGIVPGTPKKDTTIAPKKELAASPKKEAKKDAAAAIKEPSQPRQLDPNLPITKQKPAPCTLYYLKNNCSAKPCPRAHDYILTATQLEEFAKGAKRAPCPAVNQSKECMHGADCCYAHICHKEPNCFFHKRGTCKFKHASMHPESPGPPAPAATS